MSEERCIFSHTIYFLSSESLDLYLHCICVILWFYYIKQKPRNMFYIPWHGFGVKFWKSSTIHVVYVLTNICRLWRIILHQCFIVRGWWILCNMQLTRGNESQIPGSQSDWKGHVSCLEGIGVIFEGLNLDLAVDIPTYSSEWSNESDGYIHLHWHFWKPRQYDIVKFFLVKNRASQKRYNRYYHWFLVICPFQPTSQL